MKKKISIEVMKFQWKQIVFITKLNNYGLDISKEY